MKLKTIFTICFAFCFLTLATAGPPDQGTVAKVSVAGLDYETPFLNTHSVDVPQEYQDISVVNTETSYTETGAMYSLAETYAINTSIYDQIDAYQVQAATLFYNQPMTATVLKRPYGIPIPNKADKQVSNTDSYLTKSEHAPVTIELLDPGWV